MYKDSYDIAKYLCCMSISLRIVHFILWWQYNFRSTGLFSCKSQSKYLQFIGQKQNTNIKLGILVRILYYHSIFNTA